MSGHPASIRGLLKGVGIRGRGEVTGAMVAEGGYGATTGGNVEKYFGSSEGAVEMVMQQAWRGGEGRGGWS